MHCVWRVHFLTCLRVYVFSILACFVSLCAHMFHMIAVLKYLTCLCACVLLWHGLSYFLYIWKVNFQKSFYRNFFFSLKVVFRTHLEQPWRNFLWKRIKGKSFDYFAKRLKSIDFSKISSFLFPTVNKHTHKLFFWEHSMARIFINILYYLNSHNCKKKTFFSCNYGIILSVCLESFIQVISIDNSNKFINKMS